MLESHSTWECDSGMQQVIFSICKIFIFVERHCTLNGFSVWHRLSQPKYSTWPRKSTGTIEWYFLTFAQYWICLTRGGLASCWKPSSSHMREAIAHVGDCCSCRRLLSMCCCPCAVVHVLLSMQEAIVHAGGCYAISLRMARVSTISTRVAMVTTRCNKLQHVLELA
jgi:hypothetical protein